jgi:hypothetical protein
MGDSYSDTGSKILSDSRIKKRKKKGRPTNVERGNFGI